MSTVKSNSLVKRWASIISLSFSKEAVDPDFNALADCLTGFGLASAAALCRSWSLIPPDEEVWRQAFRSWNQEIGSEEKIDSLDVDQEMTVQSISEMPSNDQDASSLNQQLKNVQRLVDGGFIQQASEKLSQIAHQQGLPSALCNRVAMLKEQTKDFWQAECWYRTSLKSAQEQPLAWFGLAATLLAQKAPDEALEASKMGLKLHPNHPWGLKLQQRALTDMGAIFALKKLEADNLLPLAVDYSLFSSGEGSADDQLKPEGLSLRGKLAIASLLSRENPLIWLIGASSPRLLLWLKHNGIVSGFMRIQSFGSPDVDAQLSVLSNDASWQLEQDRPYYWMKHAPNLPDLVIIADPRSGHCNRALQRVVKECPVLVLNGIVESPGSVEAVQLAPRLLYFQCSSR